MKKQNQNNMRRLYDERDVSFKYITFVIVYLDSYKYFTCGHFTIALRFVLDVNFKCTLNNFSDDLMNVKVLVVFLG